MFSLECVKKLSICACIICNILFWHDFETDKYVISFGLLRICSSHLSLTVLGPCTIFVFSYDVLLPVQFMSYSSCWLYVSPASRSISLCIVWDWRVFDLHDICHKNLGLCLVGFLQYLLEWVRFDIVSQAKFGAF
jgi:hypothetical protein